MSEMKYPDIIEKLPDIDLNFPGVRGKLLQGENNQVVFFDMEPAGAIPPHSHQAQWGVVLDGEMELTIGGETKLVKAGDSYYIPAGVEHSGRILSKVKVMDVFDESARYRPKK